MLSRRVLGLLVICLLGLPSFSSDKSSSALSEQHRMELVRTFNADLVYIRTNFPMGKTGLTLKNGKLSPSGQDLDRLLALYGPSVKPGDRALITKFEIRGNRIRLEINGGPVKKQKWYQHLQIGVNGNMGTPGGDQNGPLSNPRGSYVDVVFNHHVPDLTVEELKHMLWPVFDFDAKTPVEAYTATLPPKLKDAILNHEVLVGMNHEMVIYSKGRPPKKFREKDAQGVEYEDWMYGKPPQDVDFVRFVGDEVVRVEIMKVDGEKIVKTQKEIDLGGPKVASAAQKEQQPTKAPTLRRPGEQAPQPTGGSAPMPLPPDVGSSPPPQFRQEPPTGM